MLNLYSIHAGLTITFTQSAKVCNQIFVQRQIYEVRMMMMMMMVMMTMMMVVV